MKKLLIFGGTFNPIHNGHIKMLSSFCDYIKPDKTLLIPTNIPVHKEYKSDTGAQDRFNMCNLAVEDFGYFKNICVSNLEIKRQGKSYTVDTLKELKLIYPDYNIFFITGADMFMTLQYWKAPKKILKLCTLCSVPRDDINIDKLNQQEELLKKIYKDSKFIMLEIDKINISSTQIRSRVKSNLSINNLVPNKVADYIKNNKLYS